MVKEKSTTEKKSPFKSVIKNLGFHNFDEEANFLGKYVDTVQISADEEEGSDKKVETFIANVFFDLKTGEQVYIGNSYSINKAIKLARAEYAEQITNVVFNIEFLGKTTVKGKPFNQFEIGYCTTEEYEASL